MSSILQQRFAGFTDRSDNQRGTAWTPFGSVIGLQLAIDRPDLVDSLMLVEPPLLDALAGPEDLDLLRTGLGPVIGAAIQAAASGDLPAAFDAFMNGICGPGYRRVLRDTLGADGLTRAEHGGFFAHR